MSTPRTTLVVGLAFACIMADGFDLQAIGFLAPDMARDWSVPLAAFSQVFSATLLGTILGATLAGFVARRIGVQLTLVAALVLFGLTTLAAVLAERISELALLRFVAGIGLGAAVPAAMSIVADQGPVRLRASLVTLTACGQPIGAIVGAAACAHFVPMYGWQSAFWLGGIVPLLLAGLVLAVFRRSTAARSSVEADSARERSWRFADLFRADLRTTTMLLWLSTFCASFFIYIIINWLPGAMRTSGSSLETSILAISLFNFGGIVGAILSGLAIDRFGAGKVMPQLFALAAVAMTFLATLTSEHALSLAAALSGLTGYGAAVSLGALAATRYPKQLHAVGIGWMLGMGRVGGAVSPLLAAAAIGAGLAIQRLFFLAAIAALLATSCLLPLTRPRQAVSQI